MADFVLLKEKKAAPIFLEDNGVFGLEKMTGIFAQDVNRVSGITPDIVKELPADDYVIYVGVCESKTVTEKFADHIDLSKLKGKREVYGIYILDSVINAGQKILAIIGSDKRGAIYGMFNISEKIGVSPWYYWADATPEKKEKIALSKDVCTVSNEPSVTYRGFFINDEQPCLGEWAKENFGSISPGPVLYEKIFELLLRLKGNYIWPAMWRSDFTLDYFENAELANEMGVIVGASHHEPCCRSGQEFQRLRHDNPQYGTDWSFLSNAEGITEFWKDGLIRNKDFENLITIGMRGENDSYLMPEDATLEDNINVLKSAITKQKELISKYAPSEHPQLLAIYKEVEAYYYGDETTPGLKDWDVLDNDIMMLCDDNFANVRTLPDDELRKHPGGFGMYYHFDYFGEPVSYLWIDSTPLSKIWEQMTMAFDYGIRSAWIVNVGDIKNQELPLSYFLDLAYDFDKWGTKAINKTQSYTVKWLEKIGFERSFAKDAAKLITSYVNLNGKRRPEALNPYTYHPAHENEAEDMLNYVFKLEDEAERLYKEIKDTDLEECYYQLVYYPVNAVCEINKMQTAAALNRLYANQRKKKANYYSAIVQESIEREQELVDDYHTRNNGKWNHMQSVYHIGFTNWNDEQCEYPVCQIYNPVRDSRLIASIFGDEIWTGAHRWTRRVLEMNICPQTADVVAFEVANGGERTLDFRLDWDADWLEISGSGIEAANMKEPQKNVQYQVKKAVKFNVSVDPEKWDGTESTMITVYADNAEVVADESENDTNPTKVEIKVNVKSLDLSKLKKSCYLESQGCISVEAIHASETVASSLGQYKAIEDYGRTLGGMKAYPQTIRFEKEKDAPVLVYRVFAESDGDYTCHVYTSASNPVVYQGKMEIGVAANNSDRVIVNTIPDVDFVPWKSNSWKKGVLDQAHVGECKLTLKKGLNEIRITAIDPAVVIEKLVLWNPNCDIRESYLGPKESKCYSV